MSIPQKKPYVSVDEYLVLERAALDKSEYYAGEIFTMAGASPAHSLIVTNVLGELRSLLRGNPCGPYDSNLRIEIPFTGLYTYPDASVICGALELSPKGNDMVTNPTLLVEVLSESTEAYDRGGKFAHYRTIPSFREYVLVSQNEPLVEAFFRRDDGIWQLAPVSGLDASVDLQSLGITLRLAEVYERVEFTGKPPLKPTGG